MRVTKLVQKATRLSDARACVCMLTIRFKIFTGPAKRCFRECWTHTSLPSSGTALYGDMVLSLEVAGGSEVGVAGDVCVGDIIYLNSNCGC
jgi:hypothetical protein